MVEEIAPLLKSITIGPDGTIIGVRCDTGTRTIQSLDLYWIDRVWDCKSTGGAVYQMARLQDGTGKRGAIPPGLDYRQAAHASSRKARIDMLRVARVFLEDPVMARHFDIDVAALREILHEAYRLPRRPRISRSPNSGGFQL